MEQKRVTRFLVGLAVLILLVVALLAYSVLPQTTHIVLPGENDTGEESDSSQEESAVVQVKITPDTVQRAIAELKRPESYCRAVTAVSYTHLFKRPAIINEKQVRMAKSEGMKDKNI